MAIGPCLCGDPACPRCFVQREPSDKRVFSVEISGQLIIELDRAVVDVVDDEWRNALYPLHTPEEIAGHVALNLMRGYRLSMLDGWADQPDSNATIVLEDIEIARVEEQ